MSDRPYSGERVYWDESDMQSISPGAFQLEFDRNEFVFLFGEKTALSQARNELPIRTLSCIIMNPFTAKRLAEAMNKVIEECESRYGETDLYLRSPERHNRISPAPEILAFPEPADTEKKDDLLFRIVEGLNVESGFERSFKISNGTLLNNRFLLGVKKEALGQMADDRLMEACNLMGMPKNFLDIFKQYVPQGNYVHFGFEQNEQTTIYKVYVEFFDAIKKNIKKSPESPAPALLHLGLKWDVAKPTRQSVTRYTWYPWLASPEILQRVSHILESGQGAAAAKQAAEQLISLALGRIPDRDILYLEVTEDGNPRRSFDINVYRAKLQLAEIYPLLSMLCRRHSIPFDAFHDLYNSIKMKRLGHLAAGLDRKGINFFTIYYGVEERFRESPMEGHSLSDKGSTIPSKYRLPAREKSIIRIEKTDEKARQLFQLVRNLRLRGGLEHSFKFMNGVLLCERFLFGVKRPPGSAKDDEITDICRQISMPEEFQGMFRAELHKANFALFGFEKNEHNRVYKVYLEFTSRLAEAVKQDPRPEKVLIYSGFKWDISDSSRKVVTEYYAYPLFFAREMASRVLRSIYGGLRGDPYPIVDAILDLAGSRAQPGELIYFEATEAGNPRKSFDINMYLADLRMAEIYPLFLKIARHYSIDLDRFDELYVGVKDQIFGHLSGGLDREGKDFLTIYFSQKGSSRAHPKIVKKTKRNLEENQ